MKFLCLCHYDPSMFSTMTEADFADLAAACEPHDRALRESGRADIVGSLGLPHETRVITRGETGAPVDGPGPFEISARPIGAFFIVDAASIDEAVAIAKLHPGPNLDPKFGDGGIEVFPVNQHDAAG